MNAKPVELAAGNGGLSLAKIQTPWSAAEIYPHGAHVAGFRKMTSRR